MEKVMLYNIYIISGEKLSTKKNGGLMNIGFTNSPEQFFETVLKPNGYKRNEILFESIDNQQNKCLPVLSLVKQVA